MELLLLILLIGGFAFLVRSTEALRERVAELEGRIASLRAPPAPPVAELPAVFPEAASEAPAAPPGWIEAAAAHAEPPPPEPPRDTLATLFERFVAGRLLIWVGGISLAVAGVFLVRYSIEIGLITPPVRMILAAVFGLLLVGAGEAARGRVPKIGAPHSLVPSPSTPPVGVAQDELRAQPEVEARSEAVQRPSTALGTSRTVRDERSDPRIAQALVGAGIFVLYAAAYGSLTLYGLIGLGTAAALMTVITAAALMLSLRHGAPTAVMGLAGGFLTPLLVGDPNASAVTLLIYLALLNAALFAIAQRRGWRWLSVAAVLLSFAWTAMLVADPDGEDALAGGMFIAAFAVAASLRGAAVVRPIAIGLVQLALLVGREDLGLPAWLLFGTLAAASLLLPTQRAEFRLLPALALMLALILLAVETAGPADLTTPAVAAAISLLFAGFAWARTAGEQRLEWALLAAAALAAPAVILRFGEPELLPYAGWAAVTLVPGLAAIALSWRQRGAARAEGAPDWGLFAAAAAAALLLAFTAADFFPRDSVPAAWLLLAIGGAMAAARLRDRGGAIVAGLLGAAAAFTAAVLVPGLWVTVLAALTGEPALVTDLPPPGRALLALLIPGGLLLLLARLLAALAPGHRRGLATVGAVLLLAGLYVPAKGIFALAGEADFVALGLAERTLFTQALFLAGWLLTRAGAGAGRALTMLASFRFVWFELIVHNPAAAAQWVGEWPVLNLLLPAYVGSAGWLYAARRRDEPASGIWLALALAALIAGVMLMVRQLFQGAILSGLEVPRGEFYGYSLAGLLLSVALLIGGIRLPDKALRVAGLALLTATVLKVFLVDAAALEGVLRILSFLGLGVALIGVGKLYARVLNAEAAPAQA